MKKDIVLIYLLNDLFIKEFKVSKFMNEVHGNSSIAALAKQNRGNLTETENIKINSQANPNISDQGRRS